MSQWKKNHSILPWFFSKRRTLIFFNRTTPKTEANQALCFKQVWIFSQKHLLYVFPDFWRQKRFFFHATQVSPLWRTPTSKLRVFHVKKIKAETESANRRQTESRAAYVKGASQHQLLFCVCGACVNWEAWYTFWLSNVYVLKMKFEFFQEKQEVRKWRTRGDRIDTKFAVENWKELREIYDFSSLPCRTLLSLHAICNPKKLELSDFTENSVRSRNMATLMKLLLILRRCSQTKRFHEIFHGVKIYQLVTQMKMIKE